GLPPVRSQQKCGDRKAPRARSTRAATSDRSRTHNPELKLVAAGLLPIALRLCSPDAIAENGGKPGSSKAFVIDTALIAAPDRANNAVFGRPLLERLMINCERAGIKRFVVATPRELDPDVARAMGRFNGSDSVSMVESFSEILNHRNAEGLGIDPSSPCLSFSGNLVIAKSQLARILRAHASNPRSVHR